MIHLHLTLFVLLEITTFTTCVYLMVDYNNIVIKTKSVYLYNEITRKSYKIMCDCKQCSYEIHSCSVINLKKNRKQRRRMRIDEKIMFIFVRNIYLSSFSLSLTKLCYCIFIMIIILVISFYFSLFFVCLSFFVLVPSLLFIYVQFFHRQFIGGT